MSLKYQRGQIIGGVTIGTARDRWRPFVGEACTDLRLCCIIPRPRIEYGEALVRATIAEVLSMRLRIAYTPLLAGLATIERKVGVLADLRAEPWAPASHPVNKKPRAG